MRPTPGRMFFLYMRDCENEICVAAQELEAGENKTQEAGENKTQEVEKTKIPSHQMNDSWGFNLFKI